MTFFDEKSLEKLKKVVTQLTKSFELNTPPKKIAIFFDSAHGTFLQNDAPVYNKETIGTTWPQIETVFPHGAPPEKLAEIYKTGKTEVDGKEIKFLREFEVSADIVAKTTEILKKYGQVEISNIHEFLNGKTPNNYNQYRFDGAKDFFNNYDNNTIKIFISPHINSVVAKEDRNEVYGTEAFYSPSAPDKKQNIALCEALSDSFGNPRITAKKFKHNVTSYSTVNASENFKDVVKPHDKDVVASLFEMGFFVNETERQKFATEDGRWEYAEKLANGIGLFLKRQHGIELPEMHKPGYIEPIKIDTSLIKISGFNGLDRAPSDIKNIPTKIIAPSNKIDNLRQ